MLEVARPRTQEGHDSHKQVGQQRAPYLPLDSVATEADKGADLERLLDFLEEGFYPPSAAIQIADARCSPLQIITQEAPCYLRPFAVRNLSLNSSEVLRITGMALLGAQLNHLISQNDRVMF